MGASPDCLAWHSWIRKKKASLFVQTTIFLPLLAGGISKFIQEESRKKQRSCQRGKWWKRTMPASCVKPDGKGRSEDLMENSCLRMGSGEESGGLVSASRLQERGGWDVISASWCCCHGTSFNFWPILTVDRAFAALLSLLPWGH